MTNNHYKHYKWLEKWLEVARDDATRTALDRASSTRLRQRLVAEIQQLESELAALQECENAMDLSMQQICREMIHSRQQFFLKLCQ